MLLLEALASTPGVDQFLEVDRFPLPTMAGILEIADRYFGPSLPGKTFAVRCKRMGRQSFKSVDVEQAVGAGLNLKYDSARVKLEDPEVTVVLEVREQELFVVKQTHAGLGVTLSVVRMRCCRFYPEALIRPSRVTWPSSADC